MALRKVDLRALADCPTGLDRADAASRQRADRMEQERAAYRARIEQERAKLPFRNMTLWDNDEYQEAIRSRPNEPLVIVESNSLRYISNLMDNATQSLKRVAEIYGLTVETVQQTLEEAAAKAARENTVRAADQPRPEAPAAPTPTRVLEWPTEKWKGSPEELSRKQHAFIAFLRRVWVPFIDDNNVIVTREILKDKDADAAAALKGYLHRNKLPPDIRILTSEQLIEHLSQRPITANRLPSLAA